MHATQLLLEEGNQNAILERMKRLVNFAHEEFKAQMRLSSLTFFSEHREAAFNNKIQNCTTAHEALTAVKTYLEHANKDLFMSILITTLNSEQSPPYPMPSL